MKHKEYWYKWYKYAKHTQAHLTQRKITLEWFGMKISDTPFFETTPLFYQPLPFYGKSLNALVNCKTIPSYRNWPYLTKEKCLTLLAPYLAEGS